MPLASCGVTPSSLASSSPCFPVSSLLIVTLSRAMSRLDLLPPADAGTAPPRTVGGEPLPSGADDDLRERLRAVVRLALCRWRGVPVAVGRQNRSLTRAQCGARLRRGEEAARRHPRALRGRVQACARRPAEEPDLELVGAAAKRTAEPPAPRRPCPGCRRCAVTRCRAAAHGEAGSARSPRSQLQAGRRRSASSSSRSIGDRCLGRGPPRVAQMRVPVRRAVVEVA